MAAHRDTLTRLAKLIIYYLLTSAFSSLIRGAGIKNKPGTNYKPISSDLPVINHKFDGLMNSYHLSVMTIRHKSHWHILFLYRYYLHIQLQIYCGLASCWYLCKTLKQYFNWKLSSSACCVTSCFFHSSRLSVPQMYAVRHQVRLHQKKGLFCFWQCELCRKSRLPVRLDKHMVDKPAFSINVLLKNVRLSFVLRMLRWVTPSWII